MRNVGSRISLALSDCTPLNSGELISPHHPQGAVHTTPFAQAPVVSMPSGLSILRLFLTASLLKNITCANPYAA